MAAATNSGNNCSSAMTAAVASEWNYWVSGWRRKIKDRSNGGAAASVIAATVDGDGRVGLAR